MIEFSTLNGVAGARLCLKQATIRLTLSLKPLLLIMTNGICAVDADRAITQCGGCSAHTKEEQQQQKKKRKSKNIAKSKIMKKFSKSGYDEITQLRK